MKFYNQYYSNLFKYILKERIKFIDKIDFKYELVLLIDAVEHFNKDKENWLLESYYHNLLKTKQIEKMILKIKNDLLCSLLNFGRFVESNLKYFLILTKSKNHQKYKFNNIQETHMYGQRRILPKIILHLL